MSMVSSTASVFQVSADGVKENAKNDRKKQRRRRNNSKKKNAVEHERQKIKDLEDRLKLANDKLDETTKMNDYLLTIHFKSTDLLQALMNRIQNTFAVFGLKEDEMQRVVKEMGYPPDRIRKETSDRYDFLRKIDCSKWTLDDFIKTANEMELNHKSCLNPNRSVILDWAEILSKTVYSNYSCAVESASKLLESESPRKASISQDVQDKLDSKRIDELETKINKLNEENRQLKADIADYEHNLFTVPEKKFRVF